MGKGSNEFWFLSLLRLRRIGSDRPWELISFWSRIGLGPEKSLIVGEIPSPIIGNKGMSLNPHHKQETARLDAKKLRDKESLWNS